MERKREDNTDMSGDDQTDGIDYITDADPDYGDYSKYDDIPENENENENENEYKVDRANGEHVDTVIADSYSDAVIQATRLNPDQTTTREYIVTHTASSAEKSVSVKPDLAVEIAGAESVKSPESVVLDAIRDDHQDRLEIAAEYMDNVDDQWHLIDVSDSDDSICSLFYITETGEAFNNVVNAAEKIATLNQEPEEKETKGIVSVAFTVPYMNYRDQTHEEQIDSVKSELPARLDEGVHIEDMLYIDIVDVIESDVSLSDGRTDIDEFFIENLDSDDLICGVEYAGEEPPEHEVFE